MRDSRELFRQYKRKQTVPGFKDSGNREWQVALDGPTIKRIRDKLGVDIANTDGTVYAALRSDAALLIDVLYLLCEKQCQSFNPKVTDEDFGRLVFGEGLKIAREALADAIVDFIPDAEDREYLREAIKAHELERKAAMKPALAKIKDPELMRLIEEAAGAKMEEAIRRTLSSSASSSPDSAESSPTEERSGS